ncbi:hypothetical protein FA15DRAFT_597317 [Coprinopsis marcescibilis]|uniref:Uncharacterized protein n=1 Tax=Coprinopsis marcescibilis TaxID=230819 RepID=A0A5C3KN99_COPMA|nr:hypothetical protein FA15DRAFT_597317 [Coprinopsis marcescibilis]
MRTQYRDLKVATVASYSPTALLWILVWVALFSNLAYGQTASQNVTVPLLSNQITYIPFLCNSTAQINNPDACAGAWLTTNIPDSPSPVISSFGQDATVGNIIPQLFFRFRASTLYLNFIPNFNATFNVTLSNTNNVAITSTILSALGAATIVGIPPELITTLAITILPSDTPTEFGLLSIMMTVPVDAYPFASNTFSHLNLFYPDHYFVCDFYDHDARSICNRRKGLRGPRRGAYRRPWTWIDGNCWSRFLLVEASAEDARRSASRDDPAGSSTMIEFGISFTLGNINVLEPWDNLEGLFNRELYSTCPDI